MNQRNFHPITSSKDRTEAEVITLGERIKLVVMATTASQRQSHKGGTCDIHPVGPLHVKVVFDIQSRFMINRTNCIKRRPDLCFYMLHLLFGNVIATVEIE